MLPLWFWVILWALSAYGLVRIVGKPIAEAARAQRVAEREAAQEAEQAEAAEQALAVASEAPGLTPLWIHLEGLTLGIPVADIQELYGAPQLVEQPSFEAERWHYPMSAEGEDGQPVSGTLVLEFERGHLTRKAFEQEAPASETEASLEASVPQSDSTA